VGFNSFYSIHRFRCIFLGIFAYLFLPVLFQYHPDVCRGSNCGVQFSLINEAYDVCSHLLIVLFFFPFKLFLCAFLFSSLAGFMSDLVKDDYSPGIENKDRNRKYST
jgi:hypothetical protein